MTAQPLETVVLPRVNGRHRDQALASARKCRATQLKLQGLGTGTGTGRPMTRRAGWDVRGGR